jgi:hypothetical protein
MQQADKAEDRGYGHLSSSSFMVATDALHAAIDKAAAVAGQRMQGGGVGTGRSFVELSRAAAAAKEGKDDDHPHNGEFLYLLDAEILRVSQAISSELKDQQLSANALLRAMDQVMLLMQQNGSSSSSIMNEIPEDEATASSTLSLRSKVKELCDVCLTLQAFVARNAELLRQVASRADAELCVETTSSSCLSYVNRRLAVSPVSCCVTISW